MSFCTLSSSPQAMLVRWIHDSKSCSLQPRLKICKVRRNDPCQCIRRNDVFSLKNTHIYILYHNSNINIHNILLDAFWACYCLQLTSVSKVLDVKPLPMLCEAPPVKKPTMKMCCACPETKVLRLLQKTPE